MVEIDELRAKAIASMATGGNPNSKLKRKSTSREEGEVSSEDEGLPTCSGVNSTINTSAESTLPNLKSQQRKRLKSGNLLHADCAPSSMADLQQRTSILENHNKRLKQLPNKSHNSSWHGRSGSNDNLIISFSDGDDTDTNSEESNSEGNIEEKVHKDNIYRPRRQFLGSHLQSEVPQCRPNNQMKILPTKTSTGRPFISSTKVQGACSRTSGPLGASAFEKDTPIQRHDSTNKISLNQELGHGSDANMADDKVRSLRQQIAVRENELRLQKRSTPECKDRIECIDAHCHGNNVKQDEKESKIDSPLDNTPGSKEIEHLRPDERPHGKVSPDDLSQVQPALTDSISEIEKQALETNGHLEVVIGSHQPIHGTALEKNYASVKEPHGESNSSVHVSSGLFQLQMNDKESLMTSNQADNNLCKERISSPPKTSSAQDMNFNNLSQLKIQERSGMSRDPLIQLEEWHDKNLEEAQERRHKCELEEMHALRAYRKAREALIVANSRCSFLYRRRELLSLYASRWLSCRETIPQTSNDLLSELNRLMDAEGQNLDQVGYKSNTQFADALPPITSNLQTSGDDIRSDQCCKHDVDVRPSDHMIPHFQQPSMLNEGEEAFPIDKGSVQSRTAHETEEVHDFELEASLRSKLVARLGVKSGPKNGAESYNADGTIANFSEMDAENQQGNTCTWIVPSLPNQQLQETERVVKGTESSGRRISQFPGQAIQSDSDELFFEGASGGNASPVEDNSSPKHHCGPKQITVLSIPSVLQIVSKHFKLLLPESSISHKEVIGVSFISADRDKEHNVSSSTLATVGSYNSDFAIDPFWPLCIFELRGKCNDEECPWQHLKDCTWRKTKQFHSTSLFPDNQANSSKSLEKVNDVKRIPHGLHHSIMPIPTYRIGSNLIKSDKQLSQSVLARSMSRYWQIGFCTCFPLPFSVQRILPPDAAFLHAGVVHATDRDNWNMPSLYFSNEDSKMKQVMEGLSDPEQTLELAFDLLNKKVNSMHARNKALSLLARAIEADPYSVVLWIVYLQIYYGKEKCVSEDDMFSHAVRFNEFSYELWHLYINSRVKPDDRMNGYDNALSVLCQRVHSPDKESKNISAHILDLSLQMIDFLCMCGDVEKAILRVNELLCPATDLGTSGHILLSDILPCLSISDRCIFWICCIYVVIYRKLPEGIIQLFELEKDLPFVIEWPTAHLSKEDKYRALQLMEKAAVTLTSDDSNLCEKDHSQDNVRRSAHFLAISHVKCVAMLDGIHSATGLLAKYVRMYPSCVELVMISVRLQKISTKESFIEGFEEALHNWPREIPGCQCLWNQYAEYALEYGRVDFAEKLMELWFHSFCETQTLQCGEEEARLDGLCDSHELPSSLSPGASFYSSKKDTVFGLLNLCLYKLLQKNMEEARYAVDKALDLATKDEFRHCVREHAAFLFSSGSIPLIDRPHTAILDLLDNYLRDIRSCSTLEPLSRRFYWSVKKPKLRQLISSLLGPVSLDFSLLNSVLEVLYGPSLLPETFEAPKDLVDYVESLITIIPANYRLALSVYNFICKNCSRDAFASEGIRFWVSSLLANSIFQSFPVAPESVWLEAANILSHLEIYGISEAFHQQAVSVYPFSLKLWQSYFNLSKTIRNVNAVVEVAKRRGFELS